MAYQISRAAALALVLSFAVASGGAFGQESSREQWQRVPEVLAALDIGPGSQVADVGAGDGFFTVPLARAVGVAGRVYAVDISADALARLRERVEREGLDNVEAIQGEPHDPRLPEGALDAALIVNAYHEMTEYRAMLVHLRRALKPSGRLVIVEPITAGVRGDTRENQVQEHEIAPRFVESELRTAEFHIMQLVDPFTTRGDSGISEWLLVAVRGRPAQVASLVEEAPHPVETVAEPGDLRITLEDFDALAQQDAVLLIDVRPRNDFERGHLPGARSVPLDELDGAITELATEGRSIVAYCD